MPIIYKVLGAAIAIVITAFAYSQFKLQSDMTQELREALSNQQEAFSLLSERYGKENRENLQEIAELRNQLRNVRLELAQARSNLQNQQPENGPFQEGLANNGELVPSLGQQGPSQSPFNMMNSPRFQELTARIQINNQYGPFINSLNLSVEEREELNSILMNVMNEQKSLQMQMASGEISMQAFQSAMANLNVEEALMNYLTDEEVNEWYDWQSQEGERRQQQAKMAIDLQLSMQTPGLTEENREKLSEVLSQSANGLNGMSRAVPAGGMVVVGEEFQADDGGSGAKGPAGIAGQVFSSQLQQFDNARQELEGTMDADQMAIVNSYLEQQEMQLELVQEMMSSQNAGQGFFTEGAINISR